MAGGRGIARPRRRAPRGMSLVEVLFCVCIIILLVGLLAGVLLRAKTTSQTARCTSNLRQIWLASDLYYSEYDLDEDPPGYSLESLKHGNYVTEETLRCPLEWRHRVLWTEISSYWQTSGWYSREPRLPYVTCLLHGAYWNVLWGDGHIATLRRYTDESQNPALPALALAFERRLESPGH